MRYGIGTALTSIVLMPLTVFAASPAPTGVNDAYSTPVSTQLVVAAPGVLANDSDPDGNPLSATQTSNPSHGSVTLNSDGSFTYTPTASYSGPDSFTYEAGNGTSYSAAITVQITMSANHAPVAANDSYTATRDTALTISSTAGVLHNDSDADTGDTLSAIKVTDPQHGALALNANGGFTYTPAASYYGVDGFKYQANDGEANSNVATVTITVTTSSSGGGSPSGGLSYSSGALNPLLLLAFTLAGVVRRRISRAA